MRLLHVTPTYLPATRYGGPIQSVHGLCAALAARGHDVHVYTTRVDGRGDSAVPLGRCVPIDGVKVWYFASPWLRRLYWSPPMARALRREVGGFDLVHLHSIFLWPTRAAARAARAAAVPYLISPRGMLVQDLFRARSRIAKTAWMILVERANLAHAAGVHVTSAIESVEAAKFGYRLGGRIVEVPNGVDLAPELPLPADAGTGYVLMLGRIHWKKRIETALEALALVDGMRLVIAGGDDGGLTPALRERAAALGVLERVEFAGTVAGEAKRRLLRGALALLMPSLSENFGNSAVEALAEGTPAIVTAQVGVAEFIRESDAGFVVGSDAAALADAIRQLRGDPELAARMRSRARAAVAASLSWPTIAARMETEYRALVADTRRPAP